MVTLTRECIKTNPLINFNKGDNPMVEFILVIVTAVILAVVITMLNEFFAC